MSNRENDLKRIRKLRKALRQVEHLLLLPRELNDDEKQKVFTIFKFGLAVKLLCEMLREFQPKFFFKIELRSKLIMLRFYKMNFCIIL
jgi:hypothetical protein